MLLKNQGGAFFTEEQEAAGVESLALGWAAVFFDYDNDGHMDLYVCNVFDANRLFVCGGKWPCTDVAAARGVANTASSYAAAVGDIDDDGDLDLMVQSNDDLIRLYVNQEGQARRWIKFDIVGQGNNGFAIGAHVRARVGSVWRYREVIAGGNSFKSQNELIFHIGLNDAVVVDEAVFMWPGGDTRTLTNLETNRTWRVYSPETLGDGDGDGDVDLDDVGILVAVLLGSDLDPDHILLNDLNGDGVVNGSDIDAFVAAFLDLS